MRMASQSFSLAKSVVALKWRLTGLGLSVIAHDPYNDEARHSLDSLLASADIVSLHAPVSDETVGMIGARQFAAMRDGVVFLNTARAQLHDTDALVDALRTGKVAAADERTRGARRVQYFFFMQVIEVETSAIRWQHKAYVTKMVR